MLTFLTRGSVYVQKDGAAPIALKCLVSVPCTGALLLAPANATDPQTNVGKSNLLVPAGETRTIGVPLSPSVLPSLGHKPLSGVTLFALLGPTLDSLPTTERIHYRDVETEVITLSTSGP